MRFTERNNNGAQKNDDVTINALSKHGKVFAVNFLFRNDCYKSILGEGNDCMAAAFVWDRVYFAKNEKGFSLYENKATYNRRFQVPVGNSAIPDNYAEYFGDYPLLFDEKEKLYYIEVK